MPQTSTRSDRPEAVWFVLLKLHNIPERRGERMKKRNYSVFDVTDLHDLRFSYQDLFLRAFCRSSGFQKRLPKVLFRNSWISGGVNASHARRWRPFLKSCQRSIRIGSIIKIIEIDQERGADHRQTGFVSFRHRSSSIQRIKEVFRHEGFMDKEADQEGIR